MSKNLELKNFEKKIVLFTVLKARLLIAFVTPLLHSLHAIAPPCTPPRMPRLGGDAPYTGGVAAGCAHAVCRGLQPVRGACARATEPQARLSTYRCRYSPGGKEADWFLALPAAAQWSPLTQHEWVHGRWEHHEWDYDDMHLYPESELRSDWQEDDD